MLYFENLILNGEVTMLYERKHNIIATGIQYQSVGD